jgi:hypothetical protein
MRASSKNNKDAWATPGTLTKSLSPFKGCTSICSVPLIKTGIRLTFCYSVVTISPRLNASSVASKKVRGANHVGWSPINSEARMPLIVQSCPR